MTVPTRSEAQQRVDEIRVFQSECERLHRDGILELSKDQSCAVGNYHRSLLARYADSYDIDATVKGKQLSLGMRGASFLGALALAASVLFLFYQFWGGLRTAVQISVLILASLGSYVATLWMQGKDSSGYFTKLVALLAFVCFVLNVVMLGQIFNITPSDKALIPWAALAFLLAYSCNLRLLLAVGILCLIAFVSARVGTWGGRYWMHFGERPENFFPAAVLLFALPIFLHRKHFQEFSSIYRIFGMLTFLLPVLVLSNWANGSYLNVDRNLIEGSYQLIGFVVSASAIGLGIRRSWPEVINTGITFFVIFLYTKVYDWCWEIMPKSLFFLVVGLIAVLIMLILKRLRRAIAAQSVENMS